MEASSVISLPEKSTLTIWTRIPLFPVFRLLSFYTIHSFSMPFHPALPFQFLFCLVRQKYFSISFPAKTVYKYLNLKNPLSRFGFLHTVSTQEVFFY